MASNSNNDNSKCEFVEDAGGKSEYIEETGGKSEVIENVETTNPPKNDNESGTQHKKGRKWLKIILAIIIAWVLIDAVILLVADYQEQKREEALRALKVAEEDAMYYNCTTIEACNQYLEVYPYGRYVADINQRREQYVEDEMYYNCTTIEACNKYLEAYPYGRYIAAIKQKKEQYMEDAMNYNCTTIEACNQYLEAYPYGRYVAAIKQKKEQYMKEQYIDLGLPSGTLWKYKNESGLYDYVTALNTFGRELPTIEQLIELKDNCRWSWIGSGYIVYGKNGNSIFLPAEGYRNGYGNVTNVGSEGSYWSSTYYGYSHGDHFSNYLYFDSNHIFKTDCVEYIGHSVRLVQTIN